MSEPVPPFGAPIPPPVGPPAEPPVPTPPAPAETAPVPPRRGLGVLGTVLVAVVVAAVVGAFAGIAGYSLGRSFDSRNQATETSGGSSGTVPTGTQPDAPTRPMVDGSIAEIADQTLPAVVSILVEGGAQEGSGSGFVIRPDGYLITNNHVVDIADRNSTLTVVFSDGERVTGKVVGTNASYDLAVVKVDRAGLETLDLGDSEGVRVGDVAIAIGAPLGLDGTVTSGIVSALDRPVLAGESVDDVSYINAIQTDAAINPGNSGGPLLDASGAVIGVNSAIATTAAQGEAGNIGLGFAIPVNSAKRVAEEIIETGVSRTPIMGVQLDTTYFDGGARVDTVTPGSGADDAGLESGDVILSVGERTIDDATELVVAVRSYAPGDEIEITYERSGEKRSAVLVLGDDRQDG